MRNSVETSALEITDQTEQEANSQHAALRNRLGDASDTSEDKKAKVHETPVETPFISSNEAGSDDPVEYVKGHPVIKNGTQGHRSLHFLTPQADPRQDLTFPDFLCRPEMMVILLLHSALFFSERCSLHYPV